MCFVKNLAIVRLYNTEELNVNNGYLLIQKTGICLMIRFLSDFINYMSLIITAAKTREVMRRDDNIHNV